MIFYSRSISTNIEHEIPIIIETSVSDRGLPTFDIFGLVSKSIGESKKRIISAFESCGVPFPLKNINVNLSPAELVKEGAHFDLAISVSILRYTHNLEIKDSDLFLGELSLDGTVRKVTNVAYLCLKAKELGFKRLFIPFENLSDVHFISDIEIYGLNSLLDTLNIHKISPYFSKKNTIIQNISTSFIEKIIGNNYEKKVLAYSIAGMHNLHLEGFPGVGKSMLARASQDFMPKLSQKDAYEVNKLFSYIGITRKSSEIFNRPFRNPHSSSSYSAILGTYGNKIYPGEVALANKGILFLDEFPEFNKLVIEGLRGPLEDKYICISRAKSRFNFSCDFVMISTSNPCKCGFFNHPKISCKCSPQEILRYRNKISGPILDRIDIFYKLNSSFNLKSSLESNNYSYESNLDLISKVKQVRDYIENEKQSMFSCNYNQNSWNNFVVQNKVSNKLSNTINIAQEKYSISPRKIFKLINLSFTISLFNKKESIDNESFFEALTLANYN